MTGETADLKGGGAGSPVDVYLCECGPIIKEAVDLEAVERLLSDDLRLGTVARYPTLCSEDGQKWLEGQMALRPDHRVVIAACSPREHLGTFMGLCRRAGVNPYLMTVANIREQCAWVTPDRSEATDKARRLTLSAINRVRRQRPLEECDIECCTDVLVIGAGVAGMTAARQLAAGGRRVCLVERSPAIGGRTALLGEVFPDLECSSCMIEPLMDEIMHHPNIELITCGTLEDVTGYFGNFTARIRKRARHVDPAGCYGCRTCHAACPVEVGNEVDHGLATRRAVYIPYTGALPNASLVDEKHCLRFNGGECRACADACPFGNIDLEAAGEIVERRSGAIVVATGAEPRLLEDVKLPPLIITAMALERLLNSSGPTGGEVCFPGGSPPRSIALIYCTDRQGLGPEAACSKTCCMSMAKYARLLHEKLPECRIYEVLWDRCLGGRGYREFALGNDLLPRLARIRLGRNDRMLGMTDMGGCVWIGYTESGQPAELVVDMAVVAPPLAGAEGAGELAAKLRLAVDADGFFKAEHRHLRPYRSLVEGILIAGSAQGPKDIQDSVAHAAAAAGEVMSAIIPGRRLPVDPATAEVLDDRCGGCRLCLLACPYQAISFDVARKVAAVNGLLCRGCGTCAAGCPSGAIAARHFTDEELYSEIEALWSGTGAQAKHG